MTEARCTRRGQLPRAGQAKPPARRDLQTARGRRHGLLAAGVIVLLLSTLPASAIGQACGTPPCGVGGAGKPISISWVQDLDFGTLAGDGTFAGTATINPVTGTKTVSGGVYDFGGIHSPATFTVKGDKNTTFTVMLPGSIILSSGANTMTLNNFSSDPSGFGVFGNNGQATLTVGATLQVGAGQPAGVYSGVFTVTVNY